MRLRIFKIYFQSSRNVIDKMQRKKTTSLLLIREKKFIPTVYFSPNVSRSQQLVILPQVSRIVKKGKENKEMFYQVARILRLLIIISRYFSFFLYLIYVDSKNRFSCLISNLFLQFARNNLTAFLNVFHFRWKYMKDTKIIINMYIYFYPVQLNGNKILLYSNINEITHSYNKHGKLSHLFIIIFQFPESLFKLKRISNISFLQLLKNIKVQDQCSIIYI